MFKNFTGFNSLAHLLFKDEQFNLVLNAFRSFQNMLISLRTEAYDYTTWYNKVMRDKYEDGEPIDVTELPYLSVPRSQLAVIRARIAKVKEAVQYAANAITNVALGNKVGLPSRSTNTGATLSPTISGTTPDLIMNAIKRFQFCIGDLAISFDEGTRSVIINGVSVNISPIVRGNVTISKVTDLNSESFVGFQEEALKRTTPGQDQSRLRLSSSQMIREYLKAPMVVARSRADLAATSSAPIGVLLMNREFYGKRLIIWVETTSLVDYIQHNDMRVASIFGTRIKADICEASEIKQTIAKSLYEYLSEDYTEAMAYNAPTKVYMLSWLQSDDGSVWILNNNEAPITNVHTAVTAVAFDQPFAELVPAYTSAEDVTEATTQTAISDMFYTEEEWSQLENSLSEA